MEKVKILSAEQIQLVEQLNPEQILNSVSDFFEQNANNHFKILPAFFISSSLIFYYFIPKGFITSIGFVLLVILGMFGLSHFIHERAKKKSQYIKACSFLREYFVTSPQAMTRINALIELSEVVKIEAANKERIIQNFENFIKNLKNNDIDLYFDFYIIKEFLEVTSIIHHSQKGVVLNRFSSIIEDKSSHKNTNTSVDSEHTKEHEASFNFIK